MPPAEYLEFADMTPPGRKTKVVGIYSVRSGDLLGVIKWFSRWRQYAFFPNVDTVWNPLCTEQVNAKIRALTRERKAERAQAS